MEKTDDNTQALFHHVKTLQWTKCKKALKLIPPGINENDVSEELFQPFVFKEDWAKIVHIEGNKFLLCGGSNEDKSNDWLPSVYSKKTFKIDVISGAMIRKADMNSKRQAHGLCKIGQYIYACGGL